MRSCNDCVASRTPTTAVEGAVAITPIQILPILTITLNRMASQCLDFSNIHNHSIKRNITIFNSKLISIITIIAISIKRKAIVATITISLLALDSSSRHNNNMHNQVHIIVFEIIAMLQGDDFNKGKRKSHLLQIRSETIIIDNSTTLNRSSK